METAENQIFTIGHSTRAFGELIGILQFYNMGALVDVRHFPRSRRNPQFDQGSLEVKLQERGIHYYWIEELGGFRKGGYESYMRTGDFNTGLKKLTNISKQTRTVIMCAELLWFRCHRGSIASLLKKNGWEVIHIFDKGKTQIHTPGEGT